VKRCEICGKEFSVYPSQKDMRFCSSQCFGKYRRKGVKVICEHCGNEFEVWESKLKQSRGKFCSRKCYLEYEEKEKMKVKCLNCGREFVAFPSEIKKDKGKFCSFDCYCIYVMRRVKVVCPGCGKEFEVRKSEINKAVGNFCSLECYWNYLRSEKGREFIERRLKRIGEVKPTSLEKMVCELLQNYFSNEWQYVGDGKVFIAGYVPDFMHKSEKWIIEANGDYWHSLPKVKDKDREKKKAYEKCGYKALEVWESEFKSDPMVVVDKIMETFYQILY